MIISHKYKYLFVELPNTASTSIRRELCEFYNGIPILQKHSYYSEFLRIAKPEEMKYFTFSCIRNPMDVVVSQYFKYKTDWKEIFTNPQKTGLFPSSSMLRRYEFIQKNNADFVAFFIQFYRFPYDDWSSVSHKKFDFIMRFESLEDDFAQVLNILNISQQRPLPFVNKTLEKEADFWLYYPSKIRSQSVKIFGPFMKTWDYKFPPQWGIITVPVISKLQFLISGFIRKQFQWSSKSKNRLFDKITDLFRL